MRTLVWPDGRAPAVVLRLPPDEHRALSELARAGERTTNAQVRLAIREHLRRQRERGGAKA
jgi:hypothetical protein